MASEKHFHEWKYNDAIEIFPTGAFPYWEVYRFCTQCLQGEIISLEKITK